MLPARIVSYQIFPSKHQRIFHKKGLLTHEKKINPKNEQYRNLKTFIENKWSKQSVAAYDRAQKNV